MEIPFKNDNAVLFENKDMIKSVIFSDCPIGWAPLVRQLFNDIRHVCSEHGSALPLVAQVKSKFGILCFYLDQDNQLDKKSYVYNEVDRLIKQAEIESGKICEITGLPGSMHSKNGWVATLNENLAEKLGYTKAKNLPA